MQLMSDLSLKAKKLEDIGLCSKRLKGTKSDWSSIPIKILFKSNAIPEYTKFKMLLVDVPEPGFYSSDQTHGPCCSILSVASPCLLSAS